MGGASSSESGVVRTSDLIAEKDIRLAEKDDLIRSKECIIENLSANQEDVKILVTKIEDLYKKKIEDLEKSFKQRYGK